MRGTESFDNQIWNILGQGMANTYIGGQQPGPEGIILSGKTVVSRGRSGLLKPFVSDQSVSDLPQNKLDYSDTDYPEQTEKRALRWLNRTKESLSSAPTRIRRALGALSLQHPKQSEPILPIIDRKPSRVRRMIGGLATVAVIGSTITLGSVPNNKEASVQQITNQSNTPTELILDTSTQKPEITQADRFYAWIEDHPGHNAQSALENVLKASPAELQVVYDREVELAKSGFYGPYNGELPIWLQ